MVNTGEVALHVVMEGTGTPVVLLHGFPEFSYGWRHQMAPLAAAGFQAIAPDLRGYDRSDKPWGVEKYELSRLAADIAGLIRGLGHSRAHVVGHDWGGIVAYQVAMDHPEVVDRLVILNAPHLGRMAEAIRRPPQLLRSWYVYAFQMPWLPERVVQSETFLRKIFRGWATHPERFGDEVIAEYARALRVPGAARAALNYYRALVRRIPTSHGTVRAPTLVLWGEQDRALGPELLERLERWVPDLRIQRFPQASHWLQHDEPEAVNAALLAFLRNS